MCWSSTKTTMLVVAVVCICMNGFNVASRVMGLRDQIREEKFSAYIPDVTDISKWVNGRENSDYICMGLAGVSLIFDFLLLGGAMRESAPMIQISGIWGSVDCVVDAIVGFLSANYTVPSFSHEETKTVHKSRLRRTGMRRHRASGHAEMQLMKEKGGKTTKTESKSLALREPPPTMAKQFLHFGWVIIRLIIKAQLLCSLFSYVGFLNRRDEAARRDMARHAGGGGGATSVMSVVD
ncbi:uncharacterized protein [Dermacentor albipictus]|uniref:uncharacterized protein n=1 Tax=Dermacentor albipictus TaxID=60249 RepID=UPI0031FC9578